MKDINKDYYMVRQHTVIGPCRIIKINHKGYYNTDIMIVNNQEKLTCRDTSLISKEAAIRRARRFITNRLVKAQAEVDDYKVSLERFDAQYD